MGSKPSTVPVGPALVFWIALLGTASAAAQQTVNLAPGERYVLVPNGAARTTDGQGGAQITLADRRRIVFSAAGEIYLFDVNNKLLDRGWFVRWRGLSAGRINVLSQDGPGAAKASKTLVRSHRHRQMETGSQALVYR